MEIALEALRNDDIFLNEASLPSLSSSKIYLKRHLGGKNYFSVENIQVIAEGELVNRFANATILVLCNHRLFSKLGF